MRQQLSPPGDRSSPFCLASSMLPRGGVKWIASAVSLILLTAPVTGADFEREVVREMNLARTNPNRYAEIVETRMRGSRGHTHNGAVREAVRFLRRSKPLPPLKVSEGLSEGARLHVALQGPTGKAGHGRSGPAERVEKFGQWLGALGENIYYGRADARGVVVALIVDDGVQGRGHRKNIFSAYYRVVGVAGGEHARYGRMCVVNFAGGFIENGTRAASGRGSSWSPTMGMFAR